MGISTGKIIYNIYIYTNIYMCIYIYTWETFHGHGWLHRYAEVLFSSTFSNSRVVSRWHGSAAWGWNHNAWKVPKELHSRKSWVRSSEKTHIGYGSIPINTIFSGMNIHLPAILMFTRGTRFWHTAILGRSDRHWSCGLLFVASKKGNREVHKNFNQHQPASWCFPYVPCIVYLPTFGSFMG